MVWNAVTYPVYRLDLRFNDITYVAVVGILCWPSNPHDPYVYTYAAVPFVVSST